MTSSQCNQLIIIKKDVTLVQCKYFRLFCYLFSIYVANFIRKRSCTKKRYEVYTVYAPIYKWEQLRFFAFNTSKWFIVKCIFYVKHVEHVAIIQKFIVKRGKISVIKFTTLTCAAHSWPTLRVYCCDHLPHTCSKCTLYICHRNCRHFFRNVFCGTWINKKNMTNKQSLYFSLLIDAIERSVAPLSLYNVHNIYVCVYIAGCSYVSLLYRAHIPFGALVSFEISMVFKWYHCAWSHFVCTSNQITCLWLVKERERKHSTNQYNCIMNATKQL